MPRGLRLLHRMSGPPLYLAPPASTIEQTGNRARLAPLQPTDRRPQPLHVLGGHLEGCLVGETAVSDRAMRACRAPAVARSGSTRRPASAWVGTAAPGEAPREPGRVEQTVRESAPVLEAEPLVGDRSLAGLALDRSRIEHVPVGIDGVEEQGRRHARSGQVAHAARGTPPVDAAGRVTGTVGTGEPSTEWRVEQGCPVLMRQIGTVSDDQGLLHGHRRPRDHLHDRNAGVHPRSDGDGSPHGRRQDTRRDHDGHTCSCRSARHGVTLGDGEAPTEGPKSRRPRGGAGVVRRSLTSLTCHYAAQGRSSARKRPIRRVSYTMVANSTIRSRGRSSRRIAT